MNTPLSLRRALSTLAVTSLFFALPVGCGDDSASGGGGQGAGGVGGNGGGGGMAPTCGPEAPGAVIEAANETWTWVDFPDSLCMNNTPTGIGINKTTRSKNVVIFLMGGNACFNALSCNITANTDGYGATKFAAESVFDAPLFDRDDPNNPMRDYSFVFVPYCTGDVHGGDRSDVVIGPNTWQFKGFKNMTAFLNRLVPTFADAEHVVLSGVSAGGFGAAFNYDQTATAFCDIPVTLIDDSGPPMSEQFVPACLQKFFVETWGLNNTLPADCAECRSESGVFMEPFMKHAVAKYPDRRFGIISSEGDGTIRQFWGFGENNCANLMGAPLPYSAAKYKSGLEDLRDRIVPGNNFNLFMPTGTEHVFLDNDPTTVTAGTTTLDVWLTQALAGDPAWTDQN